METRKQLETDLANSVTFILSTTFQVNMDMVNGQKIKVRFLPLEKRPYRFDGKSVLKYFQDAVHPTQSGHMTAREVAENVADHLNNQMDIIQNDIAEVIRMCRELLEAIQAEEAVRALTLIELILDALRRYTEVAVASKITNVLVRIIGVVNEME